MTLPLISRQAAARRGRITTAAIVAVVILAFVVTRWLLGGLPDRSDSTAGGGTSVAGGPMVVTEADGEPTVDGTDFQALAGVVQRGNRLGSVDAPVTLVEFEDLQCVACRQYDLAVSDQVTTELVKTGQVQVRRYSLAFIGPDSAPAARWAYAAGRQDRMWQFVRAFYLNAGAENSGYVTVEHLRQVAGLVPGLDVARAEQDAGSSEATAALDQSRALAAKLKLTGTPTVLVGRDERHLQQVPVRDTSDFSTLRSAVAAVRRGHPLPTAQPASQCSATGATCAVR